jgi:hypothetical protein
MTCTKSGYVCVSGAPRSAPSHRCAALTYVPGQRNQPCKTGCVLLGDDAMIAVRGRSKLKACHSAAVEAWGAARERGTPARGNAPRASVGLARQPHRFHPAPSPQESHEIASFCRLSYMICAFFGSRVTFLPKRVLHNPKTVCSCSFKTCLMLICPSPIALKSDRSHRKTGTISPMYNGLQSTIENNSVYTPCLKLVLAEEIA